MKECQLTSILAYEFFGAPDLSVGVEGSGRIPVGGKQIDEPATEGGILCGVYICLWLWCWCLFLSQIILAELGFVVTICDRS